MNGITRSAVSDDAEQIAKVINPYRVGEEKPPHDLGTIYTADTTPLELHHIRRHVIFARDYNLPYFVHEVDGEIVGVMSGMPFEIRLSDELLDGPIEHMLEITTAVKRQSINNGAGKSMHEALMTYAKDNYIHSIWAGVFNRNRNVSINLAIMGWKYVTVLEGFKIVNDKSYDLHLYRKVIK